jgi:hypothetical protein
MARVGSVKMEYELMGRMNLNPRFVARMDVRPLLRGEEEMAI